MTGAAAYPLAWPEGQPTTPPAKRQRARFKLSFARARDELLRELKLLGVGDWKVVISTNVELRLDGLPYAGRKPTGGPGAAVYYWLNEEPQVIACDCWDRVEDNLRAIGKTIEALRGIARWGSSELMHRAFSGFKALPPSGVEWRAVLGNPGTLAEAESQYRTLARAAHPDLGGNPHEMQRLNEAIAKAREVWARPNGGGHG